MRKTPFIFCMSKEDLKELERFSRELSISKAAVMRIAFSQFCKRMENNKKHCGHYHLIIDPPDSIYD